MERDLIDEFHFLLTPVAVGKGKHLFGEIDGAPQLLLLDAKRFKNGVMRLIYTPGS
jgi:dihydrofolate reductase